MRGVLVALAISVIMPVIAHAGTITLGGPLPGFRQASLTDALSGFTGTGNATDGTVEGYYGGDWIEKASCEIGDPCVNGVLTLDFSTGGFGGNMTGGTWSIASPFPYGDLAISIHVGNGKGDPDHFVWLVANNGVPAGPYLGIWDYTRGGTKGGGFSNFKVYGRTSSVPDGGTALLLLGSVLVGIGAVRKKFNV